MTALDVAVVLTCVPWLLVPLLTWRTLRAVRAVADLPPAPELPGPLVSLVIPACDEADTLEAATRTRLADAGEDLEIVLVDDRSTDATGAIADRLAAASERVQVIHVEALPDGWLGKTHALAAGARHARGDWLLFSDADVHFAPRDVRRIVADAEARGVDHVAVLPELGAHGFWMDVALGGFGRVFTFGQRLWAVEDPRSSAVVGVGAFNLVRRTAFERTPGFEWLRMEVVDDVGLGLMMKRSGARSSVLNGVGAVSVDWYPSLGALFAGLEKNTFVAMGGSVPVTLAVVGALVWIDAAPLLALASDARPWVPLLGAVALACGLGSAVRFAAWMRRPVAPALALPLGTVLCAAIALRSAYATLRRGGVDWRGTFYPLARLRAGSRVSPFARRGGFAS